MKEENFGQEAIDAVILWVDGSDPVLAAKRRKYSAGTQAEAHDDIAGATRYADNGEIKWCVRSIERFAPWIRKIYVVTDGQDPQLTTERIPMEIIDHKVIFRDFEKYLPTFNSLSLETMLWRIPGLSNRFIYFNDDVSLIAPVTLGDFFDKEDCPIVYGSRRSTLQALASYGLERLRRPRHPKVKYRYLMLNTARLLDRKEFFLLEHTPYNMRRDILEKYYSENPDVMIRNLRYRFRDIHQYSPVELQYILSDAKLQDFRQTLIYLDPKRPEIYASDSAKFLCINSLDQFSQSDRAAVINFIESKLK